VGGASREAAALSPPKRPRRRGGRLRSDRSALRWRRALLDEPARQRRTDRCRESRRWWARRAPDAVSRILL